MPEPGAADGEGASGGASLGGHPTVLYLVSEDWYFCSHRLPIARAARAAGYDVVVATRVGEHAAPILDAGIRLHPIGLDRHSLSPLGAARSLLELVRIYRAERPAIVHQVAMKPVLLGTLAACLSGVPAVVNAIAGLGYVFVSRSPTARALRPLVRLALRLAFAPRRVRVLVQNDADAAAVRALGVPAERCAIVRGSGVDTERFRPQPEPDGPIVFTMVSRMLEDKGVRELVAAARLLAARGARVRVQLVGPPDPGNPSSIGRAELERWQAEGAVEWLGARDDVAPLWAASHVGVLPSYREGLPKALLEAGAAGRALIATDVPGCRDVVVDGETGLLVPPRDAAALADAMQRLAEDAALRARLGAGARRRVEAHFDTARVARETLALYRILSPPLADAGR